MHYAYVGRCRIQVQISIDFHIFKDPPSSHYRSFRELCGLAVSN